MQYFLALDQKIDFLQPYSQNISIYLLMPDRTLGELQQTNKHTLH